MHEASLVCIKPIVLDFWTVPEQMWVSSTWLQREQTGESTSFLKYRKRRVWNSLYSRVYYNHRRHVSLAVWKTLSNAILVSIWVLRSLLYLSKHLSESLFFTRQAYTSFTLHFNTHFQIGASSMTKCSFTSRHNSFW